MDLKQLITQFTYHIESKPDGGFIARPSDPGVQALEAPTREELRQKIKANIASVVADNFPGLKLSEAQQLKISLHIERKPDGTFDIHSSDPSSPSIQSASGDEVESHFAENVLSLLGKHLSAGFAGGLGAQLTSGDVKVFVSKGRGARGVSIKVNSASPALGNTGSQITSSISSNNTEAINAGDSSPITPGGERNNVFLRFVIAAIIVIAAMYAYAHFHH